jgi:hypothetical protein
VTSFSAESTTVSESTGEVAARLEKHTSALRSIIERASYLDGTPQVATGKGALAVAASDALDADPEADGDAADSDAADVASRESRLRSYQTADAYIKKAASTIAAHQKWYADSAKTRKAKEACVGALEELRRASMVLQRRHDEDAGVAAKTRKAAAGSASKRERTSTRATPAPGLVGSLETSSHETPPDAETRERERASIAVFRARMRELVTEPLRVVTEAAARTARMARENSAALSSRESQWRSELAESRVRRDEALAELQMERTLREPETIPTIPKRLGFVAKSLVSPSLGKGVLQDPPSNLANRRRRNASSLENAEDDALRAAAVRALRGGNRTKLETTPPWSTSPEAVTRAVPKEDSTTLEALAEALRRATASRDDFARRLRRASVAADTETRALAASARDASRRLVEAETRIEEAAEESARWRALYVAARQDHADGLGASGHVDA